MAAQVKVREHGLRLLRLRMNTGPVFDDSAHESGMFANAAIYK